MNKSKFVLTVKKKKDGTLINKKTGKPFIKDDNKIKKNIKQSAPPSVKKIPEKSTATARNVKNIKTQNNISKNSTQSKFQILSAPSPLDKKIITPGVKQDNKSKTLCKNEEDTLETPKTIRQEEVILKATIVKKLGGDGDKGNKSSKIPSSSSIKKIIINGDHALQTNSSLNISSTESQELIVKTIKLGEDPKFEKGSELNESSSSTLSSSTLSSSTLNSSTLSSSTLNSSPLNSSSSSNPYVQHPRGSLGSSNSEIFIANSNNSSVPQKNPLIQKKSIRQSKGITKKTIGTKSAPLGQYKNVDSKVNSNGIRLEIIDDEVRSNITNRSGSLNSSSESNNISLQTINVEELAADCVSIIVECDPNQTCSKDELIARIAYQRKMQLKQNNGEKTQKIIAMEKILTDLNAQWNEEHIKSMNDVREKQNQIVLKNKLEPKMFKMKIDLTCEKKPGEVDKHVKLHQDSKKYWEREAKKEKKEPPRDKEAIFKKTKGNLKMPRDLQKQIYNKH